jgi:hypothetical protein
MTQIVTSWETGIIASWYRANEFIGYTLNGKHFNKNQSVSDTIISNSLKKELSIHIVEESTEQNWDILFNNYYVLRITPEDVAWTKDILPNIPESNNQGFFKIINSTWINTLEKEKLIDLKGYEHYAISTYDWFIEIIAKGSEIRKTKIIGYPMKHERGTISDEMVFKGSSPKGDSIFSKIIRAKLKSRKNE